MPKKYIKLGISNGKFNPCPKTPNCVSTQAISENHRIEPIHYHIPLEQALGKINEIIRSTKHTKIVKQTENYIHAEFKSALFKFIDDVEFYFDENQKIIHFRSASRVGYSDMRVNRKRMENFRNLYLNK